MFQMFINGNRNFFGNSKDKDPDARRHQRVSRQLSKRVLILATLKLQALVQARIKPTSEIILTRFYEWPQPKHKKTIKKLKSITRPQPSERRIGRGDVVAPRRLIATGSTSRRDARCTTIRGNTTDNNKKQTNKQQPKLAQKSPYFLPLELPRPEFQD